MKLQDLFESAEATGFTFAKDLNSEFKEMAATNDITLVHPMGWPAIVKNGAWYGGGMIVKGGARAEAKRRISMPIEVRAKAFAMEVAEKLEALMKQGMSVAVGSGSSRSTRTDVKPGHAKEALLTAMKIDRPQINSDLRHQDMPCLVWFVETPQAISDSQLLRLSLHAHHQLPNARELPWSSQNTFIDIAGTFPTSEVKRYQKTLNTESPQLWQDIFNLGVKHGIKPTSKSPLRQDRGFLKISTKILSKDTIRVPSAELKAILDKHV